MGFARPSLIALISILNRRWQFESARARHIELRELGVRQSALVSDLPFHPWAPDPGRDHAISTQEKL
jgi:hypothetical protein